MSAKPIILAPTFPGLTAAQQDCVEKLEEALSEAKKGRIHTIGIIACMLDGYGTTIGGTNAAELNLGCDSLKNKIRVMVEGE